MKSRAGVVAIALVALFGLATFPRDPDLLVAARRLLPEVTWETVRHVGLPVLRAQPPRTTLEWSSFVFEMSNVTLVLEQSLIRRTPHLTIEGGEVRVRRQEAKADSSLRLPFDVTLVGTDVSMNADTPQAIRGINITATLKPSIGGTSSGSFASDAIEIADWPLGSGSADITLTHAGLAFSRMRLTDRRATMRGEARMSFADPTAITWRLEALGVDIQTMIGYPLTSASWFDNVLIGLSMWAADRLDPSWFPAAIASEGEIPDFDTGQLQGTVRVSMSSTDLARTAVVDELERAWRIDLESRTLQPLTVLIALQGSQLVIPPTLFVMDNLEACVHGNVSTAFFDDLSLEVSVRVPEQLADLQIRALGLPSEFVAALTDKQGKVILPYRIEGSLNRPSATEALDEDALNKAVILNTKLDMSQVAPCWTSGTATITSDAGAGQQVGLAPATFERRTLIAA